MISFVIESLRRRVEQVIRSHPFLRLVQHFCIRATGISSTGDSDFGLGGLLALLALPGAFTSIMLLDKYSTLLQFLRGTPRFDPYRNSLTDEYFFIVYSMAITGVITLLRWDQLLPDARDFANLGALSLSLRKIFAANVIALGTLAGVFAIDINLVSAIVFPFLVTLRAASFGAVVEVFVAHALATLGMSAFTFLAIIALQGLLMAALPHSLYRRVALALRTALLIFLAGTLISVFLLPLPFLRVNYASLGAISWWPPLWFLSFFESCIEALRSRSPLGAGAAWRALTVALLLAVCGFSLSYKRYFLKIPERQSGPSARSNFRWLPFQSMSIFRPLLRPGFETACFQFILRTLLRSETQLLFAGLWTGVGLLLTVEGLSTRSLLVAPLTFLLFSLSGMRAVFDIPSAAAANWPFRLVAPDGSKLVRAACRKLLLIAGVLPLILIWFPAAVRQSGWRLAGLYLIFHVLFILVLVELLLWKLQKLPFTCSFVPNRDRFLKILVGLFLVIVLVLPTIGWTEAYVADQPVTLPLWIAAFLGGMIWIRRNSAAESEALLYDEATYEAFTLLRLSAD